MNIFFIVISPFEKLPAVGDGRHKGKQSFLNSGYETNYFYKRFFSLLLLPSDRATVLCA